MTSASLSPAFTSAPSAAIAASSAAIAGGGPVTSGERWGAPALPGLARRALKGAFVFFLVKGLLWLAAPLALLVAR